MIFSTWGTYLALFKMSWWLFYMRYLYMKDVPFSKLGDDFSTWGAVVTFNIGGNFNMRWLLLSRGGEFQHEVTFQHEVLNFNIRWWFLTWVVTFNMRWWLFNMRWWLFNIRWYFSTRGSIVFQYEAPPQQEEVHFQHEIKMRATCMKAIIVKCQCIVFVIV